MTKAERIERAKCETSPTGSHSTFLEWVNDNGNAYQAGYCEHCGRYIRHYWEKEHPTRALAGTSGHMDEAFWEKAEMLADLREGR